MNSVPGGPPGWRVHYFETLNTTQDTCITLANAGEPGRLAVQAARQTAARGSRGRPWTTLPGNLALSVLLRPTSPASDAGHWALLAALALAEAVQAEGGQAGAVQAGANADIRLKWPNDLMLGGAKLGGILLDSALRPDGGLDWLVIGCGVNLAAAPEDAAALPVPVSARAVATGFLARLDAWDRRRLLDGFQPIRQAWLARGPELGTHLHIRTGGREVAGAFQGLSDTGALLLQTGGRVHAFSTGELLQARF